MYHLFIGCLMVQKEGEEGEEVKEGEHEESLSFTLLPHSAFPFTSINTVLLILVLLHCKHTKDGCY